MERWLLYTRAVSGWGDPKMSGLLGWCMKIFRLKMQPPAKAAAKANQPVPVPPATPLATIPFKAPPATPPLPFKAPPATPPATIPLRVPPRCRQLWSWPHDRRAQRRFERRIIDLGGGPPRIFKAPPPWELQSVPPLGHRRAHVNTNALERPRPDRRHSV